MATDALRAQAEQAFERSQIRGDFPVSRSSFLAGYEAAARELARVTAERDAAIGPHQVSVRFKTFNGRDVPIGTQIGCRCGWRLDRVGLLEFEDRDVEGRTLDEGYAAHVREMAAREVG